MRPTHSTILLLALVLACAPVLGAQATPTTAAPDARPITLAEAQQLAQRNAPAAVQARGVLRGAAAARRSAYAAFIPSLTVSTSVTRQLPVRERTETATGIALPAIAWSQGQRLNANLDLFNGRRLYDVRAANAQIGAAEAGELAGEFQLRLDVGTQYYASLAARESEEAAQSQLAQAEQQLRVAVARVQARTATRSDSLRARIQVGQAQLALLTARNQRIAADAALSRLIASPFRVTAAAPDTAAAPLVPASLPDSAALAALAEQGPVVRQAEANLSAARALRRASRAPYLPTLSMSFGQNLTGVSEGVAFLPGELSPIVVNDTTVRRAVPVTRSGQIAFTLSYQVFNQWAREEGVVRAEIAEDNAQATLRDARLQAQEQLTVGLGTLRLATAQVEIQAATVAASEEDLRVQQQRYELGAATLLDVLTSQTQLVNARTALIQARLDTRLARARLEALIGRDLGATTR
jgi:outer membrane protein